MSGLMNHVPEEVVRRLLINLSLGYTDPTVDWGVYYGHFPATPDHSICVYGTVGQTFGKTQNTKETQEKYGIQISVRGLPDAAALKANQIKTALDLVSYVHLYIGASVYSVYAMTQKGPIIPLGKDLPTSTRRVFTLNYLAAIRMISVGTGTGTGT